MADPVDPADNSPEKPEQPEQPSTVQSSPKEKTTIALPTLVMQLLKLRKRKREQFEERSAKGFKVDMDGEDGCQDSDIEQHVFGIPISMDTPVQSSAEPPGPSKSAQPQKSAQRRNSKKASSKRKKRTFCSLSRSRRAHRLKLSDVCKMISGRASHLKWKKLKYIIYDNFADDPRYKVVP